MLKKGRFSKQSQIRENSFKGKMLYSVIQENEAENTVLSLALLMALVLGLLSLLFAFLSYS